jgi:hypothetical protein
MTTTDLKMRSNRDEFRGGQCLISKSPLEPRKLQGLDTSFVAIITIVTRRRAVVELLIVIGLLATKRE